MQRDEFLSHNAKNGFSSEMISAERNVEYLNADVHSHTNQQCNLSYAAS